MEQQERNFPVLQDKGVVPDQTFHNLIIMANGDKNNIPVYFSSKDRMGREPTQIADNPENKPYRILLRLYSTNLKGKYSYRLYFFLIPVTILDNIFVVKITIRNTKGIFGFIHHPQHTFSSPGNTNPSIEKASFPGTPPGGRM